MSSSKADIGGWLRAVPEHWERAPLRHLLARNDGGVWGEEPAEGEGTIVLRSTEVAPDGGWRIDDPALRLLSAKERVSSRLLAGDIIITKSSGSLQHLGKAALVDEHVESLECCFSNFLQRIRLSRKASPRFISYVLNNEIGREQLLYFSATTTGLRNITATTIGRISIALPDVDRQNEIADFLDRETAKIDTLISKENELIDALVEKRQSVISQALHRGLDASAPMKDSGFYWLGEVPAHWQVLRLSHACEFESGKAHEPFVADDGEHVCVNARFISTRGASRKFCNRNLSPANIGDILMVMSDLPNGRALARAFFVEDNISYAVNQRVCIIKAKLGIPRFYYYQLDRNHGLMRHDDGIHQTHLSNGDFTKLPLLVPPVAEQEAIADYLQASLSDLDKLLSANRAAIALLKERRSALVTAAITGQIEVAGNIAAEAAA